MQMLINKSSALVSILNLVSVTSIPNALSMSNNSSHTSYMLSNTAFLILI